MSEGNDRDAKLVSAARAELDLSARQLDELTRARLKAARLRALSAMPAVAYRAHWPAVLAIASVSAIVLGMAFLWPAPPDSLPAMNEASDWMTTLDDGYELYENLEFYEWLEAQSDEERV